MASLIVKITGDASGFRGAADGVSRSLDQISTKTERVSASIGSLGSSLSVGLTAPILALGAGAIKTAADMEALKMGLSAVAKGSDTTEKQLARLKEVAKLPGLGFAEAIQGSVRLQAAGFSAQLAERSLKAFGNALATAGKGKADLDGVTLALTQIASKGKISAEEINQLAERVPQIRMAMKAAFGTADTEVLQKAGIGAEEFVTRVVAQLEKLKQVSGGTKNSLENLGDKFKESADRIGQKMLPAVNEILPKLEKLAGFVADVVDEFTKLPDVVQNFGLGIIALAAASGPIAKLISRLVELRGVMATTGLVSGASAAVSAGASVDPFIRKTVEAMGRVAPAATAAAGGFSAVGAAAAAAGGAGVGGFLYWLSQTPSALENQKKASDAASDSLKRINDRYQSSSLMTEWLTGKVKETAAAHDAATPPVRNLNTEIQKGTDAIKVRSVADLIYVEGLQRMKTAVEKAKDVMYEWSIQGTAIGKQLETWKAPVSAMTLEFTSMSGAIATATENMRMMSTLPPPQIEINQAGRDAQSRTGITGMNNAAKTLGFETDQERYQRLQNLSRALDEIRAAYDRGQASGTDLAKAQEAYNKAAREGTPATKTQQKALQQVSTVITDMSRGITDIIFKGGKFGDMMANVAKTAAQAITRELIEGALTKLSKKLLDVGGIFGTVFGGGTGVVKSVVPGVTAVGLENGGLGKIPGFGGSSGGSGGAASSASSSVAGIVGAVGSVVSAVSGVIGNFQMAGMNKSLDLIEKEVRYSQIHLLNTLNKANEYWPYMRTCWESLIRMEQRGVGLAGGGTTINMAGAYLLTDAALDDFIERFTRRLKTQGL